MVYHEPHVDMSANTRHLAPPTTKAGLGASETWIEKIGPEIPSEENTASPTKSNWSYGQEEKSAAAIDEKIRKSDLEMGPVNAFVTEKGATDQAADPDAGRYLTGFRLLLLFVCANLYLKWDFY
jgi:hypothetical protein